MPIPDYQSLMLPVLKRAAQGEVRIGDVVEELAEELGLTPEERAELLPSGRQTTFANRVHWAKTYLKQAGLVELTKRAHFRATQRGLDALAVSPPRIDVTFLSQYPEFNEFRERRLVPERSEEPLGSGASGLISRRTPEEEMRVAHRQLNSALGQELLDRILTAPPEFFERLIVSLLLAMGYGGSAAEAGRAIGRSGDDGIDGVIDQDALGLDQVYVQAKRYKLGNSVGPSAIRDFFGSLNMKRATKGLFVTTSTFSDAAAETALKLGARIILVDGEQLTALMIRHNVGCRVEQTLSIQRVDEDFFES